jgi:hypothetical protein
LNDGLSIMLPSHEKFTWMERAVSIVLTRFRSY